MPLQTGCAGDRIDRRRHDTADRLQSFSDDCPSHAGLDIKVDRSVNRQSPVPFLHFLVAATGHIIEIRKRTIALNTLSAVVTRVLRVTVLVWVLQFLLRRISPEEFAVYGLVTAVMVFAPLFSSFFTGGISRYVVEACARNDERRARQIVSSIFPVLLFWGVLFSTVGWAVALRIDSILSVPESHRADARIMLGLLVTDFAFQMIISPFSAGMHVRQKFLLLNSVQLAGEVLRILTLFALLFGVSARVLWLVVASVGVNVLVGVVITTISLRLLPAQRVRLTLFEWKTARQLMSFGFWTTLNQLAAIIYINCDIILLNRFAGPGDVAAFKLASEFYNQANGLVLIALSTVIPVFTSFHARSNMEDLRNAFIRGARYVLWFSLLLTLPLVLYHSIFVQLYAGARYAAAGAVIALLLLLFPLMGPGFMLAPLTAATGRIRTFSIANIVVQLIKLAVTLVLLKQFSLGAIGCAWSTFVVVGCGHLLVFGPMAMRLAGVSGWTYIKRVAVPGYLPALGASLVWYVTALIVQPSNWWALAFCAACGSLAYLAILYACCLDPQERGDLKKLVQGARRAAASFPGATVNWAK